jgi:hypothetical protein
MEEERVSRILFMHGEQKEKDKMRGKSLKNMRAMGSRTKRT